MHQFRFDAAEGKLSANAPPSAGVKAKAGPRHFVFHPKGTHVYLLNELNALVDVLGYDLPRASSRACRRSQYPMGKNPNWVEIVTLP